MNDNISIKKEWLEQAKVAKEEYEKLYLKSIVNNEEF